MEKTVLDAFKMEIKTWLDSHQDEYDAFLDGINKKLSMARGLEQILLLYSQIAPNLMEKTKKEMHRDIVPSEWDSSFFKLEVEEASKIKVYSNLDRTSLVHCFFVWIFLGSFYETMVDTFRNLIYRLYPESKWGRTKKWINEKVIKKIIAYYVEKPKAIDANDCVLNTKFIIKGLVATSLELQLRKKKNWENYIDEKCSQPFYSNKITKNAILDALSRMPEEPVYTDVISSETEPMSISLAAHLQPNINMDLESVSESPLNDAEYGDSERQETFEDCLHCSNKPLLLTRIKSILQYQNSGLYLAFLYVALIKLGYWNEMNKKLFHELLVKQFPNSKLCGYDNFRTYTKRYFNDSLDIVKISTEDKEKYIDLMKSLNVDNVACENSNIINK